MTGFDSTHHQEVIENDWLWATVEAVIVANRENLILGREALLLHLCGHLVLHHRGQGLLWWNDIAQFLQRYGKKLNWHLLFSYGQRGDFLQPLMEPVSLRTLLRLNRWEGLRRMAAVA
jgi:hypothetical protein